MKWFRLYDELVDDPKMILLPADIFRNVIFLWCVASQNDGYLPPVEAVAVKLRLPVARTRKLLGDLRSRGLIDQDADGRLSPHNWNGRQYKSDGPSTPRVKRFRGRNKDDPGNGDETFHETEKKRPETSHETTKKHPQSQKTESESESDKTTQQPQCSEAAPARPQSLISAEAYSIAEELWQTAGFSKETLPAGWCGSPMAIQKWLNDGCPGEVVKVAVESVLKRKTPDGFGYFDKPIASAFAQHRRPLPTVAIVSPAPIIEAHHARKRTVIDAADDLISEIDARIAAVEAREAGERTGETSARLLPPGRRN